MDKPNEMHRKLQIYYYYQINEWLLVVTNGNKGPSKVHFQITEIIFHP